MPCSATCSACNTAPGPAHAHLQQPVDAVPRHAHIPISPPLLVALRALLGGCQSGRWSRVCFGAPGPHRAWRQPRCQAGRTQPRQLIAARAWYRRGLAGIPSSCSPGSKAPGSSTVSAHHCSCGSASPSSHQRCTSQAQPALRTSSTAWDKEGPGEAADPAPLPPRQPAPLWGLTGGAGAGEEGIRDAGAVQAENQVRAPHGCGQRVQRWDRCVSVRSAPSR